MRFCIYLHEEGLLNERDCLRAIRTVCDRTPPLGRLAIRNRLLSVGQLRELLQRQTEVRKPMGRLAVEVGYLTEIQVQDLITQQRSETPTGLEIVKDLSLLSLDAIEQAHQKFLSLSM